VYEKRGGGETEREEKEMERGGKVKGRERGGDESGEERRACVLGSVYMRV
jgi:hypothetical protein